MSDERVVIADEPFPLTNTQVNTPITPFGERWGGEVIVLNQSHLDALLSGQTLLLDVQGEYLVNLRFEDRQNG
jgi:hypothetical protein